VWIFFIFRPSKIHVSLTDVISALSPSRCRLSSGRHRHTVAPCYTSFTLSQDEVIASASSFSNILSRHLLSRAEIEVLNTHHHHRLPSLDRLTHIFYCYKKIILTVDYFPHHSTKSLFYLISVQNTTSRPTGKVRTAAHISGVPKWRPFSANRDYYCLCTVGYQVHPPNVNSKPRGGSPDRVTGTIEFISSN
jgi:hypothetical protein